MPLRRLPDRGDDETERLLAEIEKRISGEYAKAEREIQQKLNDYLAKFQKKDELKRRALAAGEITQAEYDKWRLGQIMIGQRWDEMRTTLAEDLANVDQIARSIAFGHLPEVYAINHNYGTFQVETGALVDTSYTLYDRHTVERLCLDDEGRFIPSPGRRISEEINLGKALPWNKKNVQSVMMQGIMQGESIPNLATRLAKSVGEQNRGVAIRNARTLVTGVQNAGRMDSYERAKDMGIKVKKQWLATLDMRTRHWHVELDGVSVDVDEPFENEYGTIMFPGDPEADPSNIYNCRCTMIAAIEGFERDLSDLGLRHDDHLEGMTYDEWKEEHETYSEPITRQDQIAATMRRIYGAEYAHYATLSPVDTISSPIESPGNPSAILHFGEELSDRQKRILSSLSNTGDRVILKKSDVSMIDLSALTAETGVEYALFTKGNTRMVVRGDKSKVYIDAAEAGSLAKEGYRFSGHTHTTVDPNDLMASSGDYAILDAFGMKRSVIYNPAGQFQVFELMGGD